MNPIFKDKCVGSILKFESSFKRMQLSPTKYANAYRLVDKLKSEINLDGASLGFRLRHFYEFFSRELLPGGIVLSEEARKDFSELADLCNSPEFLKTVHSPFKIF